MKTLLVALLLLAPAVHAADAADALSTRNPLSMFEGTSTGTGELRFAFGRARPYTVDNVGRYEADGTLRLQQVVHFAGQPDTSRAWVLRPAGGNRYTFTLSDATGPGVAVVDGARASLRYAPRHGVRMHQVLELSADGRSLANHGRITVLGIPIGHLDESIVRTSAP
ncbi:hypothetical protein [Cognatilysobacter lacus]|uniref:DUF3833 family protein n=1 Tax=Cognatilysobacter lacus TaxID=1643323 RepID=A0A5D8Z9T1_9GAMM|nr:hypothetical protein [Lysobacter lacus]TZF91417.1 hypothetical protein FW784_01665 [Lysobacter lacus]